MDADRHRVDRRAPSCSTAARWRSPCKAWRSPMTLSRRSALKLGLGAGALHLLGRPGIVAAEGAAAPRAADAPRLKARPLPLSAVRLTGGPLQHAQDLDRQYLLALEPDRMLAYYRQRAGL